MLYEVITSYFNLYDSLLGIEKTKAVNDLMIKYEREKDQARLLAMDKKNLQMEVDLREKTAQRNTYLYGGLAIILIAIFLFIYLQQRYTIARQKIRQLEEEQKLMAAQLLVEGQEQERKRIAQELHSYNFV